MKPRSRVVALGLAVLALLAIPASAHQGGRVQLFASRLEVRPAGDSTWSVHVTLIDADSGQPAAGFDVRATVDDRSGQSLEPITLDNAGQGRYVGQVSASLGEWLVSVRAKALPGGDLAVPLERTWALTLGPEGAVATERPASTTAASPWRSLSPALIALVAALGVLLVARRRRRPNVAVARR